MSKQTAICRSVFMLTLLFLLSLTSFSQTSFKVSGKVFDENGKPVEGATVQVKGTTIATSTIADGSYSLMAPSGNSKLVITSVGYTQMEVAINNKEEVIVHTSSIASSLQDVVVIGYTTVKRKDVTGAIGGINQKDIKSRPVDNALQAMQGKVAGVDIGSNERPGTIPSINIRGVRSLTASNSPLFVVDGIPLTTGGIENINPNDIETIDVLKDASATAIYGSRGANGVVIITTKSGKGMKKQLEYNGSVSFSKMAKKMPLLNRDEFLDAVERFGGDRTAVDYRGSTDWQNEIAR